MKVCLLMIDLPIYVSCKFDRHILKSIALVINKNVRVAFLNVLST